MSDGYYKYRCKNFYSHNCTNWVWMNNTVCAACIAAGREEDSESCGDHLPINAESPMIPAAVSTDGHLLDNDEAGLIQACTGPEQTRAGINDVDTTASSKGLGDLFEPDSYHS